MTPFPAFLTRWLPPFPPLAIAPPASLLAAVPVPALPPGARHAVMWALFVLTYAGIALGRFPKLVMDRAAIAVLGAVAMLVVGGVDLSQAAHAVDKATMLLLFGLMTFSAQLRAAGFPVLVNGWLSRLADRPRLLLAAVIGVSAAVSALLANDIVCLAFTPLLCEALLAHRRDPLPYLLALATSANVGSAATIIGNPQNMYLGSRAGLDFAHFAAVMAAPVVAGLVCCWLAVAWVYRRRLDERAAAPHAAAALPTDAPAAAPADPRDADPRRVIDRFLISKTLGVLAVLVGAFLWAGPDSEMRAVAALAGAGVLLISRRPRAAGLLRRADWNLLLLFVGLFVVNGAMRQQKLTDELFARIASTGVDLTRPVPLSAVTLGLSNLVSNVPAVLLLEPPVARAPAARRLELWYVLALVSTWAGNLTLVGSIANLIVAESAAPFGVRLDLKTYCKVGVPLTLVTVLLGTLWLMVVM